MPGIGEKINGARLWVHLGSIEFQPVEIAKLLIVVFWASYLIDKRELLTISTRRVGNRMLPDLRAFGPMVVAGVLALLIILAEHDIGFSLLLFLVFLVTIWMTTGRWTYVAIGLVVFVLATFAASHVLGQVNERISDWLDPWVRANRDRLPARPGRARLRPRGLFGTGIGFGSAARILPVSSSDFIFAVIGEELGFVGAAAVVCCYAIIVGAGLRAARRARSEFARLVAAGLTATLGLQAFLIMAGNTRLLPLTGVTLPFVSYGGSSLVANYALLGAPHADLERGESAGRRTGRPELVEQHRGDGDRRRRALTQGEGDGVRGAARHGVLRARGRHDDLGVVGALRVKREAGPRHLPAEPVHHVDEQLVGKRLGGRPATQHVADRGPLGEADRDGEPPPRRCELLQHEDRVRVREHHR